MSCTPEREKLTIIVSELSKRESSVSTNDRVCNNAGERKVTLVMLSVFGKSCESSNNLMLDIGANMGYYGLLATKSGCEALFFDLQNGCQKFCNNAIVLNGFQNSARVVPFGVESIETIIRIDDGGFICDGRFPVSAREKRSTGGRPKVEVSIAPLSKFVDSKQRIAMMKIDTEGNENRVLQGGLSFFRDKLVDNAIVEITPRVPSFWKGAGTTLDEVVETFRTIASFGYTMVSLFDWRILETEGDVAEYIRNSAK